MEKGITASDWLKAYVKFIKGDIDFSWEHNRYGNYVIAFGKEGLKSYHTIVLSNEQALYLWEAYHVNTRKIHELFSKVVIAG